MLRGFQARLEALRDWEGPPARVSPGLHPVPPAAGGSRLPRWKLADADRLLLEALEILQASLSVPARGHGAAEAAGAEPLEARQVALARGHLEEARAHFIEALKILDGLRAKNRGDVEDDLRTRAVSLAELAEVELALGNLGSAAALYGEALSVQSRNEGAYNQYVLASTLGDLAEVLRKQGDMKGAENHLQRALQLGLKLCPVAPWATSSTAGCWPEPSSSWVRFRPRNVSLRRQPCTTGRR